MDKNHQGSSRGVVWCLSHLGQRALKLNKQEEALGYLEKAFQHDPSSIMINRNLAVLYLYQGSNDLALVPRLRNNDP